MMRPAEINPYAPPLHDPAAVWPLLPADRWPSVQLTVVNVTRGSLSRTLRLAGTVAAEIHYDGWTPPTETVRVNGAVRGRGNMWDFSLLSPFVDFAMDGDGYLIPARIDVQAGISLLTAFRIARFRLTVAGQVIYEE